MRKLITWLGVLAESVGLEIKMINEHDIKDMSIFEEAYKAMPPQGMTSFNEFVHEYGKTLAKMFAEKCDKAWYYDAANLIRSQAGIPVSCMSPCQKHGVFSDNYEEGL
jgi:hypothetical protein